MRTTAGKRAPVFVPDSFGRDGTFNAMNLSSVRVAGVGGMGLLLVAGAIALQYQLVAVTVILGAAGGALMAFALIRYRRTHASTRPRLL